MDSTESQQAHKRLAPLLLREGVDIDTATVDELNAGMARARKRHTVASDRARAVLAAHARGDVAQAGALLEQLEPGVETTPPPIPDALTVASRLTQTCQAAAPKAPEAVIARVRDSARIPDAPDGLPQLCAAVLVDHDAAAGLRDVALRAGPLDALYASAAMAALLFGAWSAHTRTPMLDLVDQYA